VVRSWIVSLIEGSGRRIRWEGTEIGKIPAFAGSRVQQLARVFLLRILQDASSGAILDDSAILHNGDIVADLSCDAEIMSDEEDCNLKALLEAV
jgi:hypothetical protein